MTIDLKQQWSEAVEACFAVDPEALFLDARTVAAVGMLETGCGSGWKPPGDSSNNKGAIQATKAWRAAGGAEFGYTDSHPVDQEPGAPPKSVTYKIGFRVYPTSIDGWIDLAALLRRTGVTGEGGASQSPVKDAVSRKMRATGYYEGFGNSQEERIANHSKAYWRAVNTFNRAGVMLGIYDAAPISAHVTKTVPEYWIPKPELSVFDPDEIADWAALTAALSFMESRASWLGAPGAVDPRFARTLAEG